VTGFRQEDACPCSSVAEHSLGKGEVASSILAMGSIGVDLNLDIKSALKKGTHHGKEQI
jgi:hypothetical protein